MRFLIWEEVHLGIPDVIYKFYLTDKKPEKNTSYISIVPYEYEIYFLYNAYEYVFEPLPGFYIEYERFQVDE